MKVYGYYNKKKGNEDKLKKSDEGIMVKKKEVHIKVEEKRKESNKRKKGKKGKYKGEKEEGDRKFKKKGELVKKGCNNFFNEEH